MTHSKILYAASTASHLRRFHEPYINALQKEHKVYLMATEGEGIDFPVAFSKSFFSPSNLKAIGKIRRILKRERFDRVIVNTSLAAFLIRAAMFGMRRRPFVLNVVHGYLFSTPIRGFRARLLLFCEKIMRNKTDAIAVMNQEDFVIAKRYRLTKGQISYIWGMGIPDPETPPARNGELHDAYAKDGILLTFVGELSKRKNQIFLIRALQKMRDEGLPVSLLLAGEGSERERLEDEIDRLGLASVVHLVGNVEPIRPYLAATDIYVSASSSEGLPFNVMEAMAAGLPVILSDTKGQNDLHQNDASVLYPMDDTEAFCLAVRSCIQENNMGVGSHFYPHLGQYRLPMVWEANMEVLQKGEWA